jgi:hypothetical protein
MQWLGLLHLHVAAHEAHAQQKLRLSKTVAVRCRLLTSSNDNNVGIDMLPSC